MNGKVLLNIFNINTMRRRFSPNAVASSDGDHTKVSHDRRANTTGRTEYAFCGDPVIITQNGVYRRGNRIGWCFTDDYGNKYLIGPSNKGRIDKIVSLTPS